MKFVLLCTLLFATLQTVNAEEIFDAVRAGDIDLVKRLVSEGEDLASVGPVGTPLHLAALRGDAAVGEVLIKGCSS